MGEDVFLSPSLPPSLPLRLQKLENLAQSILASCATTSVSLETLEQEVEEFETLCTYRRSYYKLLHRDKEGEGGGGRRGGGKE